MNNTIPYDGTEAASLSQRIALLLCGLEMEALSEGDCARLRTKPRVHLMEELIEYQTLEKGPVQGPGAVCAIGVHDNGGAAHWLHS